jgi:hypothetical protein
LLLVFSASLLLGSTLRADPDATSGRLGQQIANVVFKDASRKAAPLREARGEKATVVVFLSFDCPVSNSYAQPLADLATAYRERGVAFVGVCTNPDLTPAQVAKHVREFQIPFPVYKDERTVAADAFGAQVTPEAFVLDGDLVLRYRGRIDDGYVARLKKNLQIQRHDLRQALDQLLAGQPVSEPSTKAVGCAIRRETGAPPAAGPVTFHRDVLPILQNHCQVCHRPGAVAPFSLLTYRQAVNWASDLKEYTQTRRMPPWKPVDGLPFHNERRLSEPDIATLAAWMDTGTPEGDPRTAPEPRQFPEGWQLGQPDLVLTVDEDFHVGPTGTDLYRCFVLPTNLTENKDVTAVEVRPGNARVVHHALLVVDSTRQGRRLERQEKDRVKKETETDRGPGYSVSMGVGFLPQGGLGGWAPGQVPRYLPEGAGYYLPKGSDVIVQAHYHRSGRAEKDRTSIGLYFAKTPLRTRFQSLPLRGRFFSIPAGEERYRVTGSMWVDQDCVLHTVLPHMHMLGREIKVTVTPPDGSTQTLVAINDWDYNWQETYLLKESLPLKAGTRFDVEAYYDNSAKNPANPNNPPKRVYFGQQTTDEMCFVFLGLTSDQLGRLQPRYAAPKLGAKETDPPQP